MNLPIALNSSRTLYDGFVLCGGRSHRIQIYPANKKEKTNYKISCDWKLRHKLKDYLPLLKERLESCNNLDGFLSDLRTLIDNVIDHTPVNHFPKYYDVICNDLEDIGWEKIKSISPQFRKIELEFKDTNERTHILRIIVTDNYPQESPEISTELPCPFIPLWVPGGSLLSVCEQFTTSLEMYQYLWDSVDELKRECWVLEPEHPNYSCTSLRISLGKNCSLQIQVTPLQPDELPECHFLGSNSVVAKLQAKYQQGYEDWSENLSILQNITAMIGAELPKRKDRDIETNIQCGICYCYRLGTDIPNEVCNEEKCNQIYHHQCLLEWLRSIPGVKQSFGVLFGECPYCCAAINVKILAT